MKYHKDYRNETEEKTRMETFLNNKRKIDEHNQKHAEGSVSYKMGLNKFSDLSTEEMNAKLKGLQLPDLLTYVSNFIHLNLREPSGFLALIFSAFKSVVLIVFLLNFRFFFKKNLISLFCLFLGRLMVRM